MMKTPNLGRLEKVKLREAWASESGDFTPWLARSENLELLGEAIGIDLEYDAQEKGVGQFRADILCKDTSNDSWVLIENQLEKTDHNHLGQLITYAAGLNAVTIVWIAETIRDEHRAAIDWLNERTDKNINLFGLEIELWRIGDSPVAPKFNIVSQPNDWSRTIQEAASAGEMSEHRQLQLKFWTKFREHMEECKSIVKCQKAAPQQWMNHAIGRSGAHLASILSTWNSETGTYGDELRVELQLVSPQAKQEFAALQARRDEIEKALGFKLVWHEPENVAKRKLYTRADAEMSNEKLWQNQFEWLRTHLEAMHRVLGPIVRDLKGNSKEE